MITPQFILPLAHELVVDLFAGGGGASMGIEQALGRHVDIAVNHDADAIALHEVNHPQTRHFLSDVFDVDPRAAAGGRAVGLLHASPDCTHHSQARGGQPRSRAVRSLSWVVHRWAGTVRPRVITLENVEQILQWSPLVAKRDPKTGRALKLDGAVAEKGERVPVDQQFLVPDASRKGRNWRHFVEGLRAMGYAVQWKTLVAADFGAPTTRERLFMIARCDGEPIVWPEATHGKKRTKGRKPWRSAAECIDWSIPCRSIFDREKPLAEATLRRIARGMQRYLIDAADPFIVKFQQNSVGQTLGEPLHTVMPGATRFGLASPTIVPITHGGSDRAHDASEPMRTITTAHRGEFALAAATLVQMGYGERDGQAPRALDLEQPLGTVVAGSGKHGLACAFLAQANGGFNDARGVPGHDLRRPMSTIQTKGANQQLVAAHLAHLRGNCDARPLDEPLRTVSAGGEHHALLEYRLSKNDEAGALRCAAFLMRYHGTGGQWADLRDPAPTITTRDRLALVTVWLRGEPYVIVDIGLRMLAPRELYAAQGFPSNYVIDRTSDGRLLSKSAQVRMCGNSVSPAPMRAIVEANYHEMAVTRRVA